MKKGLLPTFSIANNLQIGTTPPELTNLTLPEKLLISINRPKLHVRKLVSYSGPGTTQKGLKGNTITFPQDIEQIAKTLPANPDILVDHLKVVFIGSGRPTHEQLKKILTVRKQKVYNAIRWLQTNNPLYHDVTLSNVDLPINDIPEQVLSVIDQHDDPDNEDANSNL